MSRPASAPQSGTLSGTLGLLRRAACQARAVAVAARLLGIALTLPLGCSPQPASRELRPRTGADSVSYSQVWQLATHNSFWAERRGGDPWASGISERLLDQLLADGARTIELDLHPSEKPHEFRVYHLQPGDSQCDSLRECLAILRLFQHALPQHRPLLVMLELKSLFTPMWDAEHTPDDLDRILREEMGAALYTPGEYLQPCLAQGVTTLRECMEGTGWPAVNDLAGRVLFAPMGYWHMFGGSNDVAWVEYSRSRPMAERAGFPLAINTRYDTLSSDGQTEISAAAFDAAMAENIVWYSEDEHDPLTAEFVGRGGIVLYGLADAPERQQIGIAKGLQLLQTDTPWISLDSDGRIQPLRILDGRQPSQPIGERDDALHVAAASDPATEAVLLAEVPGEQPSDWEATLISGHDPGLSACLRAASQPLAAPTSVSLCRELVPNRSGLDSLRLRLTLQVCKEGRCQQDEYLSGDGSDGGAGERVSLRLIPQAAQTCVAVRSARVAGPPAAGQPSSPRWTALGQEVCVPGPLPHQGVVRRVLAGMGTTTRRDAVSFFQLQRNGRSVTASDLAAPVPLRARNTAPDPR